MEHKTCPSCKQNKPITEYNWKRKKFGTRQAHCRACTKEQLKRHYQANRGYYVEKARIRSQIVMDEQRQLLLAYLALHPCVDCGESDVVCLEFDHVRGEKGGEIGRMLGDYPCPRILEEIAKCDVRCANCHRRKTNRQYSWYRSTSAVEGGARSSTG
jgi:hypothetical protein